MFALVRFIDDIGSETRRYVVRVEDIEDFCPAHEADFDAKAVYFVHWTDIGSLHVCETEGARTHEGSLDRAPARSDSA